MTQYVNEFLSLKCSGDVMNVCFPIGNKPEKEITETMTMIKRLKRITLKEPMKYSLFDFCAGNALTSVLSVFLLPVNNAIAVDKRPRKRRWHLAKRFDYLNEDIYNLNPEELGIDENSIIIGVHACSNLAKRIIEIYNESKAKWLLLMPCCQGDITKQIPFVIREKIDSYLVWTWQLMESCKGRDKNFYVDTKCLSPKNAIIVVSK